MKIVFLSDDFPPKSFGGAGISTCELAVGIQNAGHEVSVITTCRQRREAGWDEYRGVPVFKIVSDYPGRWRSYCSVYNPLVVQEVDKHLTQLKPDVVHVNNVHYHLSYGCIKVAKRHAKVVVFTARDTMTFTYGKLETRKYLESLDSLTTWRDHIRQAGKRWNPFRNVLIRRYLGHADARIAISKSLKEALQNNRIWCTDVIYNGIDVEEWDVSVETAERFRTVHDLSGKKVLLFSGRLSEAKGGSRALEALALISKEIPEVALFIAGVADEYTLVLKEKARALGVADRLVFSGWIPIEEMKVAYAAADVVLMPSLYLDAFGRVNIEAMASRKPVVGTRYGGTPEIVEDGVTGFIVDPRHPREIADKVIELLKDSKKAERFGTAGYKRAKYFFNNATTTEKYLALFDRHL